MDLRLEVATPDDAELVADLTTAVHPDEPGDPVVTRAIMEGGLGVWEATYHLAFVGQRPAGVAVVFAHPPQEGDAAPACMLVAGLALDFATPARMAALYDLVEARASAQGWRRLLAVCPADDAAVEAELGRRGYRLEREERHWELDLRERREHVLAERERSRERMGRLGVRLMSLSECPEAGRDEQLLHLTNRANRDAPRSVPYVDMTLEQLRRRLRMPDLRSDRYWSAWRDGRMVALSYLLFPPVRGHVFTGFTGTDPDHRGLGIARAVKMETLGQAVALGVPRVRTGNDAENAPILHINQTLGYRPLPPWRTFAKTVEPAGPAGPL